ncbi:OmpA family protein [Lutibacter sp.]|uniref:OmpA family protein n=1 Tax=Lutibacter sp. TaxID=1925666 RepID=UPI0027348B80|nr:OmpA family protein [Lutibacter sp.]MDP3312090.1 OmpA family protein [Lutibacter sp.]
MKKILHFVFLLISVANYAQQFEYEVSPTSINSKFAELGVTYINDQTILFASSQKNANDISFSKERRKQNRQLHLEIYLANITNNGDLIQGKEFNLETKNMFFESDVTFSPDQKTIYFTWNNFYNTEKKIDSAEWKTLRIVKATINENHILSNIKPLPFNSENYSVRNPTISKDGKKLYFVSDMPGGFGDTDIYMVEVLDNNTYGLPVNLGSEINSKKSELFPFIDENNILYFSSYGHNSIGGLDIFKSEFRNEKFGKRVQLPTPINSIYDDFAFVINNSSNSGYITSNRPESLGDVDIFKFIAKEKECIQLLNYQIVNSIINKPINNVKVSLYKNNSLEIDTTFLLNASNNVPLNCNTYYKMIVQLDDFEPYESEFNTNDKFDLKLEKTISLIPIPCNQNILITIVDAYSNNKISNVELTLISSLNSQEKSISDLNGMSKLLVNCNSTYNIKVFFKNYEPTQVEFKTDDKKNSLIAKTILLTPIKCVGELAITVVDNITNLKISNASISLLKSNIPVDSRLTNLMELTKFNIECSSNYKVLIAADNYETQEFTITTDASNEKILAKTISLNPIKCEQELIITVIDDSTKQRINNAKISLLKSNTPVDSRLTNLIELTKFNIECSASYKIIVTSTNFEPQEFTFTTDNIHNSILEKMVVLTPIRCKQDIVVNVIDAISKTKIKNAIVTLNPSKTTNEFKESNTDGIVTFTVECDKEYSITVEAPNFEVKEITVSTNNSNNKKLEKNVLLSAMTCLQSISGIAIDSITKLPINDVQLTLIKNNLIISKTKSIQGAFNLKLECNTSYTIEGSKVGYGSEKIEILTSNVNDEIIRKQLLFEAVEEFSIVSNLKMIKTNPIYFELDKSEITLQAAIELDKVVSILNNYPTIIIEVRSHTDSRATDSYNMTLSNDRAKSIINYIISKGIDAARISGIGLGETQLINKCSNGVPCTTIEHEKNRRTEFVVIKN